MSNFKYTEGSFPSIERQSNYETVGGGSNFIFLSLYLLLLAFFIFIVAISNVEHKKSQEVLQSVRETFPGKSWVEPKIEPEDAKKDGDLKVRVKSVFEPVLGDNGFYINGGGEYVQVKLKTTNLFPSSDSSVLSPTGEEALQKITALLGQTFEDDRRPFLSILVGDNHDVSMNTDTQTIGMTRLGHLIDFILAHGALKKTVSIGLDDSRDDSFVHFQFRLRPDNEPSMNLGKVTPS